MSDLTSLQPLDKGVRVLCEYEFTPGESEVPFGRAAGPKCAPAVSVTRVLIGGEFVDAGVFHPGLVAFWECLIAEEHQEAA